MVSDIWRCLKRIMGGATDHSFHFSASMGSSMLILISNNPCAFEENVSHLSGTKVSLEQAVPTAVGSEGQPPKMHQTTALERQAPSWQLLSCLHMCHCATESCGQT